MSMTPVSEIIRLGHLMGIDGSFRVLDLVRRPPTRPK